MILTTVKTTRPMQEPWGQHWSDLHAVSTLSAAHLQMLDWNDLNESQLLELVEYGLLTVWEPEQWSGRNAAEARQLTKQEARDSLRRGTEHDTIEHEASSETDGEWGHETSGTESSAGDEPEGRDGGEGAEPPTEHPAWPASVEVHGWGDE